MSESGRLPELAESWAHHGRGCGHTVYAPTAAEHRAAGHKRVAITGHLDYTGLCPDCAERRRAERAARRRP